MKGSESFVKTIGAFLQTLASTDDEFARKYMNPNKTIEKCVYYILNEVKKSGCNGFDDEEIYGMAVHYYDEDVKDEDCKPVKSSQVVVNHKLSEEEKKAEEEKKQSSNTTKPTKVKKPSIPEGQLSLF